MVEPLVSVAVITYNMEDYLPQMLDSIVKQKVKFEYEIIIDDDHSPDNSRSIILEYAHRYPQIKPMLRNHNVGGSRNMYGVLQNCRGKYVAILEGDDYWEVDDKLQYQVDFLESHPEFIGMTCNSWCEHGMEATFKDVMRKRSEPRVFTLEDFKARHFHDRLPTSTDTWVFRNIFREYADEDFTLLYKAHNMIWDQPLILLLYGKGNIYADYRLVSHHRSVVKAGGTNYQSLIARENRLYNDSLMYKAMEDYMKNVLHEECGAFYEARGEVWLDAVFRALKSKSVTDRLIMIKITHEQSNKFLLARMMVAKLLDITGRKLRLHK